MTGFGFALVFPALGMEAVRRCRSQPRLGTWGLCAFPRPGARADRPGGRLAGQAKGYGAVYLFAAVSALLALGLSVALSMRRDPAAD